MKNIGAELTKWTVVALICVAFLAFGLCYQARAATLLSFQDGRNAPEWSASQDGVQYSIPGQGSVRFKYEGYRLFRKGFEKDAASVLKPVAEPGIPLIAKDLREDRLDKNTVQKVRRKAKKRTEVIYEIDAGWKGRAEQPALVRNATTGLMFSPPVWVEFRWTIIRDAGVLVDGHFLVDRFGNRLGRFEDFRVGDYDVHAVYDWEKGLVTASAPLTDLPDGLLELDPTLTEYGNGIVDWYVSEANPTTSYSDDQTCYIDQDGSADERIAHLLFRKTASDVFAATLSLYWDDVPTDGVWVEYRSGGLASTYTWNGYTPSTTIGGWQHIEVEGWSYKNLSSWLTANDFGVWETEQTWVETNYSCSDMGFTLYGTTVGYAGGSSQTEVRYYDCTTDTEGTFTALPGAIWDAGVDQFDDGDLLIAAFYSGLISDQTSEVWRYDFDTETISYPAVLPAKFDSGVLARLDDERFILVCGRNDAAAACANAYLYSTTADLWTAMTNYPLSLYNMAGCGLPNNTAIFAGGYTGAANSNTSYIFSGTDLTWSAAGNLPQDMFRGSMVAFGDGAWYIGGRTNANSLDVCYEYDMQAKTWDSGITTIPAIRDQAAVVVVGGTLAVMCGYQSGVGAKNTNYHYGTKVADVEIRAHSGGPAQFCSSDHTTEASRPIFALMAADAGESIISVSNFWPIMGSQGFSGEGRATVVPHTYGLIGRVAAVAGLFFDGGTLFGRWDETRIGQEAFDFTYDVGNDDYDSWMVFSASPPHGDLWLGIVSATNNLLVQYDLFPSSGGGSGGGSFTADDRTALEGAAADTDAIIVAVDAAHGMLGSVSDQVVTSQGVVTGAITAFQTVVANMIANATDLIMDASAYLGMYGAASSSELATDSIEWSQPCLITGIGDTSFAIQLVGRSLASYDTTGLATFSAFVNQSNVVPPRTTPILGFNIPVMYDWEGQVDYSTALKGSFSHVTSATFQNHFLTFTIASASPEAIYTVTVIHRDSSGRCFRKAFGAISHHSPLTPTVDFSGNDIMTNLKADEIIAKLASMATENVQPKLRMGISTTTQAKAVSNEFGDPWDLEIPYVGAPVVMESWTWTPSGWYGQAAVFDYQPSATAPVNIYPTTFATTIAHGAVAFPDLLTWCATSCAFSDKILPVTMTGGSWRP